MPAAGLMLPWGCRAAPCLGCPRAPLRSLAGAWASSRPGDAWGVPLPGPAAAVWHGRARDAAARTLSPRPLPPPAMPRLPLPVSARGFSLPAPARSVPPAPLPHQLVPLQDALPGHAFDGHLQAMERGGLSSSPASPQRCPSSHARPSRPLTGLPSERRMPEKTVPKPPLPSCGPSWYSSCSSFLCPAKGRERAISPAPRNPPQRLRVPRAGPPRAAPLSPAPCCAPGSGHCPAADGLASGRAGPGQRARAAAGAPGQRGGAAPSLAPASWAGLCS